MSTVTVVTEAYQVCLGTDVSDSAPTVMGVAFTSRAAAEAACGQYLKAQAAGNLDPDAVAGKTFYVVPVANALTVTGAGAAVTREEALTQLAAVRATIPLYAKLSTGTYTRVTALPAGAIGDVP